MILAAAIYAKKIMFKKQEDKLYLLLGLFIGSLLTANLLGSKITAFTVPPYVSWPLNIIVLPFILIINAFASFLPQYQFFEKTFLVYDFFSYVSVSVGILTVPIMFLVTDIVAEVMGKNTAKKFVLIGMVVMLFTLAITAVSVVLPADSSRQYFSAEAYKNIFGTSIRITIASIAAFLLAQLHDVWAFHFWKKLTNEKFLWLRNNASTIVSQFIDSTIFMFIAFWGIAPRFTAAYIFGLIIPYWIFKILFALFDTPFIYLGVTWLKKK